MQGTSGGAAAILGGSSSGGFEELYEFLAPASSMPLQPPSATAAAASTATAQSTAAGTTAAQSTAAPSALLQAQRERALAEHKRAIQENNRRAQKAAAEKVQKEKAMRPLEEARQNFRALQEENEDLIMQLMDETINALLSPQGGSRISDTGTPPRFPRSPPSPPSPPSPSALATST